MFEKIDKKIILFISIIILSLSGLIGGAYYYFSRSSNEERFEENPLSRSDEDEVEDDNDELYNDDFNIECEESLQIAIFYLALTISFICEIVYIYLTNKIPTFKYDFYKVLSELCFGKIKNPEKNPEQIKPDENIIPNNPPQNQPQGENNEPKMAEETTKPLNSGVPLPQINVEENKENLNNVPQNNVPPISQENPIELKNVDETGDGSLVIVLVTFIINHVFFCAVFLLLYPLFLGIFLFFVNDIPCFDLIAFYYHIVGKFSFSWHFLSYIALEIILIFGLIIIAKINNPAKEESKKLIIKI